MTDVRLEPTAIAIRDHLSEYETFAGVAVEALIAADGADDHVRVPREVLLILRERAAMGDLGTIRWRLDELLGGQR